MDKKIDTNQTMTSTMRCTENIGENRLLAVGKSENPFYSFSNTQCLRGVSLNWYISTSVIIKKISMHQKKVSNFKI